MDYSKIKSYVDYQRYSNVDNIDLLKRKEAFLVILQNEIDIAKATLDTCENPEGCKCAKAISTPIVRLRSLKATYTQWVKADKKDLAEYRPELEYENIKN